MKKEVLVERECGGGELHRCKMKSNPTMKRLNSLTSHIRLLLMTASAHLQLLYYCYTKVALKNAAVVGGELHLEERAA